MSFREFLILILCKVAHNFMPLYFHHPNIHCSPCSSLSVPLVIRFQLCNGLDNFQPRFVCAALYDHTCTLHMRCVARQPLQFLFERGWNCFVLFCDIQNLMSEVNFEIFKFLELINLLTCVNLLFL